jgi:hypothetical protein
MRCWVYNEILLAIAGAIEGQGRYAGIRTTARLSGISAIVQLQLIEGELRVLEPGQRSNHTAASLTKAKNATHLPLFDGDLPIPLLSWSSSAVGMAISEKPQSKQTKRS